MPTDDRISDTDTPEASQLRQAMVESQLKGRDITDERVLAAMAKVPRHLFGVFSSMSEAYADNPSTIGCSQTISQPYMVALMTQELKLHPNAKVLDVGTGSGYQTAVLCELCRQVYSIERHPELAEGAGKILTQLGYSNSLLVIGDGSQGIPEAAPFDRILVAAAAPGYPETLVSQLSPQGGIMIFPMVTKIGKQELFKVTRKGPQFYEQVSLGEVRFVPLVVE